MLKTPIGRSVFDIFGIEFDMKALLRRVGSVIGSVSMRNGFSGLPKENPKNHQERSINKEDWLPENSRNLNLRQKNYANKNRLAKRLKSKSLIKTTGNGRNLQRKSNRQFKSGKNSRRGKKSMRAIRWKTRNKRKNQSSAKWRQNGGRGRRRPAAKINSQKVTALNRQRQRKSQYERNNRSSRILRRNGNRREAQ